MTILYVDDETQALKYFKRALQNDFDIMLANSVDEGIALLKDPSNNIEVIISDQRMPKKYGVELLTYSLEHHPAIVRMLTTAYSDISCTISAINNAEVFRYIPKPWDIDEMAEIIQSALCRHKQLQESLINHSQSNEQILSLLDEDCKNWKGYAQRAYTGEDIYRHGIEALFSKYYLNAKNTLTDLDCEALQERMEFLVERKYLT